MNRQEFERIQAREGPRFLEGLLAECRQRYLDAARLLDVRNDAVGAVSERWRAGQANIWPLLPAYNLLATRYAAHYFSPQELLFPAPAQAEDSKWFRYLHWRVKPKLLDDTAFIRGALRAACLLPSERDPHADGSLVLEYVRDLAMPEPDPQWNFLELRL